MPCNLAVTITKAAVLPEHLQLLLTSEVVEKVVRAYLQQHSKYKDYQPLRSRVLDDNTVRFFLSSLAYSVTITYDRVYINFPRFAQDEGNALATELTTLLSQASNKLFAAQVKQSLQKRFGVVSQQSAKVDNEGEQQTVTVFKLEI